MTKVGEIEKNIKNSKFKLAAFLDMEWAFKNVKLQLIHNALYASSISSILIDRMRKKQDSPGKE